jgi:Domain of unknown function (DUF1983)/Putative phage tail protein
MPFLAGLIAPVVGAISAGGAAIGGALLSVALSVASSLLQQALSPKKEDQGGISGDLSLDAKEPTGAPFGRFATEGQLAMINYYGKGNKFLQLVFILSDLPCGDLIDHVWMDGKKKDLLSQTVTGTETAKYHVSGYGDKIRIRYFDGTQTAADSQLTSNQRVMDWDSNSRLRYAAYVSVTLEWNEDKFPNGLPSFKWVIDGAKGYDLRKDSTNGGSGSHRLDDHTTWERHSNPVAWLYHYRRGIRINGVRILGQNRPGFHLDAASYRAAANICDEDVDNAEEGTQKRYFLSTYASDGQAHAINIMRMLKCCDGYEVEKGGVTYAYPGAARIPNATIAYGSHFRDEAFTFRRFKPIDERVNQLFVTYNDPSDGWETEDLRTISNSADVTADKSLLEASIELEDCVRSRQQANRIGWQKYREGRLSASGSFVLPEEFAYLTAGDWVNISLPSRYNFNSTAQIVEVRPIPADEEIGGLPRRLFIAWKEVAASTYTLGVGDFAPPYVPLVIQDDPELVTGLTNFQVGVGTDYGFVSGSPRIKFTWDPPDDPLVKTIAIQMRPVNSPAQISNATLFEPETGEGWLSRPPSGGEYEYRATINCIPVRPQTWTGWTRAPVINDLSDRQVGEIDALRGGQEALTVALMETQARVENGLAALLETTEHATDSLGSDLVQSFARITQEEFVRATETLALAARNTRLEAIFNGNTAETAVRLSSTADAGAATSIVEFQARATVGGTFGYAGLRLKAEGSGSRVEIDADKFTVGSSATGVFQPVFSVAGGQVQINGNLVVDGTITAAKIPANTVTEFVETIAANAEGTNSSAFAGATRVVTATIDLMIDDEVIIEAQGLHNPNAATISGSGNIEKSARIWISGGSGTPVGQATSYVYGVDIGGSTRRTMRQTVRAYARYKATASQSYSFVFTYFPESGDTMTANRITVTRLRR